MAQDDSLVTAWGTDLLPGGMPPAASELPEPPLHVSQPPCAGTMECDALSLPEAALWQAWRQHADADARSALLALHLPHARVFATGYYARQAHDEVEFADYLQLASVGLLEALDRFDPERGVQFRSFAARRMHGAILNGLDVATERQQQAAARRRFELQRRQALKEVAAPEPADNPRSTAQALQHLAEVGVSFALGWILDGSGMLAATEPIEIVPFYHRAEMRELYQRLLAAVDTLPAQEREVIRSHYLQQVPFEDIAAAMQVTRSRVSQVHRKALQRMRATLETPTCDARW